MKKEHAVTFYIPLSFTKDQSITTSHY